MEPLNEPSISRPQTTPAPVVTAPGTSRRAPCTSAATANSARANGRSTPGSGTGAHGRCRAQPDAEHLGCGTSGADSPVPCSAVRGQPSSAARAGSPPCAWRGCRSGTTCGSRDCPSRRPCGWWRWPACSPCGWRGCSGAGGDATAEWCVARLAGRPLIGHPPALRQARRPAGVGRRERRACATRLRR